MQKEVTDSNDTFKFEIKEVVAETIKELHAADTGIRFKKPTTVQGWLAISIATITIISFFISSIIFLNEVTQHHKKIAHDGAFKIVDDVQRLHDRHVENDEFHRKEEQLQLQILRETRPLIEKLGEVKEDVKAIETKVDILIDREFARNN
jgi:hypothetical protein